MAIFELTMPKMGESIMEATILKWCKNPGDAVALDENILEIATDKVDSEIPSPVAGIVKELKYNENDVVPIGKVIALIDTGGHNNIESKEIEESKSSQTTIKQEEQITLSSSTAKNQTSKKFYSPLVKNIAQTEGISFSELDELNGTGQDGRVTKHDILKLVEKKKSIGIDFGDSSTAPDTTISQTPEVVSAPIKPQPIQQPISNFNNIGDNVEIIEMDRLRKLIADHMVMSKQTSPHVTSFVEVDVTEIVNWRNKVKKGFEQKHNQNITFTPIFIEAVVKSIRDFPLINVSVEGSKIIRKKDINIGMAAALPSGNLIVPVIKNADSLNLTGITKSVNDLAQRARENKLRPEEIQGGTFTLTNVGTFGNVMGTPIINQPQVAILATGAIRKKPAVLETEFGDVIAIRHMMYLSLSYDHRVVDGSLGGSFLRRIADYLEKFDTTQLV